MFWEQKGKERQDSCREGGRKRVGFQIDHHYPQEGVEREYHQLAVCSSQKRVMNGICRENGETGDSSCIRKATMSREDELRKFSSRINIRAVSQCKDVTKNIKVRMKE